MRISNVHERTIAAPAARVGALLNTLSSADDKFWPHENWPRVKFNLPLQVGATGGHGTGPYTVSSYTPGRHLRFEFSGGRQGYHEFTVQDVDDVTCLLRHALKAELTFKSAWRWYFRTRPLHNALIEDLFDKIERQLARVKRPQFWNSRVQRLRQERGLSPVKNEMPPQTRTDPEELMLASSTRRRPRDEDASDFANPDFDSKSPNFRQRATAVLAVSWTSALERISDSKRASCRVPRSAKAEVATLISMYSNMSSRTFLDQNTVLGKRPLPPIAIRQR